MKILKVRKLLIVPVLSLVLFSCGNGAQNESGDNPAEFRVEDDEMRHDGGYMGEDTVHEDEHMHEDSIMLNTQ